MQSSAQSSQQRQIMVSAVLDSADRFGDFTHPWERTPDVWTCYASEAEILNELGREWQVALGTAVSCAIENGRGDLRTDVAKAYRQVSESYHSLRRVLQANGDHPVLATTMRKERTLLEAVGLAPQAVAATL